MSYIEIDKISKIYNKDTVPIYALDEFNLKIEKGEFLAIVGRSGSGKSTLLNCLGCLDTFESGNVFIDGINISTLVEKERCLFRRKNIGFVFQFFNLISELTVFENIIFSSLLEHKKYDKEYIKELIARLELQKRLDHTPDEISGGQQQRTAIARAFSLKPALVLLDEPTGNLDQQSNDIVIDMILELHKEFQQTILIVTHDNEIAKRADRIIYMADGKMVEKEG